MNHNQVADLVRTIITMSWENEIYDFANVYARYDAKPERIREIAQAHFSQLGALKGCRGDQ